MSRARTALGAPDPQRAGTCPIALFSAGQTVWRAHDSRFGPWYFGNTGAGRFDLLHEEIGGCYVAFDAGTALREKLGEELLVDGGVDLDTLARLQVSALELPSAKRAADVTHPDAWRCGLTREINTVTDDEYALTRQWATAFWVAGFTAVHYAARFSTGPAQTALVLYDDLGPRGEWPVAAEPVSGAEVARQAGVTIRRRPPRGAFTVVRPGGPDGA